MRPQWLGFGLLTLALGISAPGLAGAAETEVTPTAVLGLEAIDVPAALADDIAEQLRQKVAASRDLHLVSGKDLVEVKLVFGCADEAAQCMAQAGKSLDAQRLIYGSIKKNGDEFALWLKMFDVRKAKIEFWLTENIPKKNADPAGVKGAAGRWFAKLTGKPVNAGTVQVSSNVFGAKVFLDGTHVGITSEQPIAVPDVAPGRHEISAERAGYATAKQQFLVAAGATAAVQLTMQSGAAPAPTAAGVAAKPAPPVPPAETQPATSALSPPSSATQVTDTGANAPAAGDSRGGYRTGFWVTLAAGLVGAGAAVKFGLEVRDVNNQLDPYRRFACMGNQVCDGNNMVKTGSTATLTKDERDKVSSLNDEGKRAQTLQWLCIGVGSALGVASGYLFYKGYLDSDDDRPAHEARRGLRIFPTAAASSGGVLAEFDF
jgi:hypothetical protein